MVADTQKMADITENLIHANGLKSWILVNLESSFGVPSHHTQMMTSHHKNDY